MSDTLTQNPAVYATPTGEPDRRSRDEWLLLAIIAAGDLSAGDVFWREHVNRSRQGMLSLEGWRWDAHRQLYIGRTGQEVGGADLKRQAESLVDEMQHEMMAEAQRVAVGELSIDDWQRRQAEDVKDLNIVLAALACGGWTQFTRAMQEAVEGGAGEPGTIAYSLDKLYGFAHDIYALAASAATEAAIATRAGMYSEAGLSLYEAIVRKSHVDARDSKGRKLFLKERNILGPNEDTHCTECPELTSLGWMTIGSMPAPGLRQCVFRCHCRMEYSLTRQD